MSEPLLKLADAIGGPWPSRIREALVNLFEEQSVFDLHHSQQLLADVRDCFAYHGYSERLSTAMLLEWMQSLPARPWDADGPITARTIAKLLAAFEIHPRVQRNGQASPARGYQLQDFVEPWQAHLGFNLPDGNTPAAESVDALVTDGSLSEISNKDAGCNAITDSGVITVPAPEKPVRQVEDPAAFGPASSGLHAVIQQSAI